MEQNDRQVSGDAERVLGFDDYKVHLGDEMRGRRASLGKSLLDVERDLHIRASQVDAIEKADPLSFEVNWVIPGHVRSYARYLQMDPEDAFRRFCEECGFDALSTRVPRKKTRRNGFSESSGAGRKRRKRPLQGHWPASDAASWRFERLSLEAFGSAILLVAVASAIIYFGWVFFDEIRRAVSTDIDPAATAAGPELGVFPAVSQAGGNPDFPDLRDNGKMVLAPGSISNIAPHEVGFFAKKLDTEDLFPVVVRPDAAILQPDQTDDQGLVRAANQVTIVPTRDSWIKVTDNQGTTYFERVLPSGEHFVVPEIESSPVLRAGNSGWLFFVVGNEVFGPVGTGAGIISNVDLSAGSIRENFTKLQHDTLPPAVQEIARLTQADE